METVSFRQVQAAGGHRQLHLAMKSLRSGRLDHFTTVGVANQSLSRPPKKTIGGMTPAAYAQQLANSDIINPGL
ncbi:hypothetical protein ACU12_10015 [Xanthomonas oryzae pv. oryzicola]|nr:hypothetical protein ACU12_10015 [Xanthomonas oryzae pv. oryzicola]